MTTLTFAPEYPKGYIEATPVGNDSRVPSRTVLVDGIASVVLAPGYWDIHERTPYGISKYVLVPASGTVAFSALASIDPDTLEADDDTDPIWAIETAARIAADADLQEQIDNGGGGPGGGGGPITASQITDSTSVGRSVLTAADAAAARTSLSTYSTTQVDTALSGKAATAHTHAQADVTGLAASLAGKANTSHTHATSDVTGLDTALAGKASTSHTHATSDVTGLDTALAGKAATSHTHAQSDVTGLTTALAGKAATSHTHASTDISDSTAAGRSLLTAANAAAQKTALSLVKTDVGLGNVDNTTDASVLASAASAAAAASKSADTIADGTTNKAYTATEQTKLSGIAAGATVNQPDGTLKNRLNHSGTQAISTVSGLQTALDDKALLQSSGTASSSAGVLDLSALGRNGTIRATLTENITSITLPTVASTTERTIKVVFKQAAASSYTVATTGVKYSANVAPAMSSAFNAYDVWQFWWSGADWFLAPAVQAAT